MADIEFARELLVLLADHEVRGEHWNWKALQYAAQRAAWSGEELREEWEMALERAKGEAEQ